MTPDALSAPLGQNRRSRRRFDLVISARQLLLGMLGLLLMAIGAWALIRQQPTPPAPANASSAQSGKKPEFSSVAPNPQAVSTTPTQLESAAAEPGRSAPVPTKTITIIDGTSGKRQEIVIPDPAAKRIDLSEPAEISPVTRNPGRARSQR